MDKDILLPLNKLAARYHLNPSRLRAWVKMGLLKTEKRQGRIMSTAGWVEEALVDLSFGHFLANHRLAYQEKLAVKDIKNSKTISISLVEALKKLADEDIEDLLLERWKQGAYRYKNWRKPVEQLERGKNGVGDKVLAVVVAGLVFLYGTLFYWPSSAPKISQHFYGFAQSMVNRTVQLVWRWSAQSSQRSFCASTNNMARRLLMPSDKQLFAEYIKRNQELLNNLSAGDKVKVLGAELMP